MNIDDFLRLMVDRGASDGHLKAGMPPGARISGHIEPFGQMPLRPEHTQACARHLLDDKAWNRFLECNDLDTSYSLPGTGAFAST